jgi:hypothetical protein
MLCKSLEWAINFVGKWSHLFLGKNKVNQRINSVFVEEKIEMEFKARFRLRTLLRFGKYTPLFFQSRFLHRFRTRGSPFPLSDRSGFAPGPVTQQTDALLTELRRTLN